MRALAELTTEIEEDRAALASIMSRLGVRVDQARQAVAWTAEKPGRLKLNGQLTGYSPLSRLEELEILELGVSGKLLLWEALGRTLPAGTSEEELTALACERGVRGENPHLTTARTGLPPGEEERRGKCGPGSLGEARRSVATPAAAGNTLSEPHQTALR